MKRPSAEDQAYQVGSLITCLLFFLALGGRALISPLFGASPMGWEDALLISGSALVYQTIITVRTFRQADRS